MSLEPILAHILQQAKGQSDQLIQEAHQKREQILQQAKAEAERLEQELLRQETMQMEAERQRLLVEARLEAKSALLQAKQGLITEVFAQLRPFLPQNKFKKQQVEREKITEVAEEPEAYLNRIKLELETDVAKILFGD